MTAVAGDVRDAEALAEAMRGVDAVVSILGIGKAKDPANLITDSTRALVQAAEVSGTKRVVIMSAFGVGESLAKASRILRFPYIDLNQLDRLPDVPRISRADVAAFLLSAAAEGPARPGRCRGRPESPG